MRNALIQKGSLFFLLFLVVACTRVTVKPDVAPPQRGTPFTLPAVVAYEGNPAYFPEVVVQASGSDVLVTYEYKLFYEGTKLNREILAGLMPTTLLGLPTGGDDVLAVAMLTVSRQGAPGRTYSAEALVTRRRSIFGGGVDKTEMRRLALIAVKENLETQLTNDAQALLKLTGEEDHL